MPASGVTSRRRSARPWPVRRVRKGLPAHRGQPVRRVRKGLPDRKVRAAKPERPVCRVRKGQPDRKGQLDRKVRAAKPELRARRDRAANRAQPVQRRPQCRRSAASV
ncbi:MAG: hypothetical protein WEA28_05485, partial [Xanthobacteraceae bacterium]